MSNLVLETVEESCAFGEDKVLVGLRYTNTSGRIDAEFLRLSFCHDHRETEGFFRLTARSLRVQKSPLTSIITPLHIVALLLISFAFVLSLHWKIHFFALLRLLSCSVQRHSGYKNRR